MRDPCNFCWYELTTPDVEAAKAFYCPVIGWEAPPFGEPNRYYTILSAQGRGIGGIVETPQFARGAGPAWVGYIAVPDAHRAAEGVVRAGGSIRRPVKEIPGVGRFAVVADPQGAVFVLMAPFPVDLPPPVASGTPGHPAWRELYTSDWQAALDFYAGEFGWSAAESLNMGAMGTYQMFSAGAEAIGGMMNDPNASARPFWLYYFWVDAIDDAAGRVRANGGEVIHGPSDVPGGSRIIHARDPQGAMFGLAAPAARAHEAGDRN
ncbi:MAG: VOC family protein [Sphingomonadales bacterium]